MSKTVTAEEKKIAILTVQDLATTPLKRTLLAAHTTWRDLHGILLFLFTNTGLRRDRPTPHVNPHVWMAPIAASAASAWCYDDFQSIESAWWLQGTAFRSKLALKKQAFLKWPKQNPARLNPFSRSYSPYPKLEETQWHPKYVQRERIHARALPPTTPSFKWLNRSDHCLCSNTTISRWDPHTTCNNIYRIPCCCLLARSSLLRLPWK